MWALFDAPIGETGILTEETGKVWYDSLVGGLRRLGQEEMKGRGEDAVFGLEFPRTFRINTQVYLQWFVSPPPLPTSFLLTGWKGCKPKH